MQLVTVFELGVLCLWRSFVGGVGTYIVIYICNMYVYVHRSEEGNPSAYVYFNIYGDSVVLRGRLASTHEPPGTRFVSTKRSIHEFLTSKQGRALKCCMFWRNLVAAG